MQLNINKSWETRASKVEFKIYTYTLYIYTYIIYMYVYTDENGKIYKKGHAYIK